MAAALRSFAMHHSRQVTEMFHSLTALREAGFPVDQMSESQREVLASLTEEETAVIMDVQRRLLEAAGDVVAHDLKML